MLHREVGEWAINWEELNFKPVFLGFESNKVYLVVNIIFKQSFVGFFFYDSVGILGPFSYLRTEKGTMVEYIKVQAWAGVHLRGRVLYEALD
jgi:hypothetical protein